VSDHPEHAAEAFHERHAALLVTAHESTISFGKEAMKAAVLLSGGSAAAVLAFMAQVTVKADLFRGLSNALAWFVAGLIMACLASGSAYLAQMYYGTAGRNQQYAFDPPFVIDTPESIQNNRFGRLFHWATALLCIAAYLSVICGFWLSYSALKAETARENGVTKAPTSAYSQPTFIGFPITWSIPSMMSE
jgi:hypothetical protein